MYFDNLLTKITLSQILYLNNLDSFVTYEFHVFRKYLEILISVFKDGDKTQEIRKNYYFVYKIVRSLMIRLDWTTKSLIFYIIFNINPHHFR